MPIKIIVAPGIREKLADKHQVKEEEVRECFMNIDVDIADPYLEDDEEDHRTDPPSYWFIAPTNRGRLLKVIFVLRDGNLFLKSAFNANEKSRRIYTERINKLEK